MLVCDRCGSELSYEERKDADSVMTIYAAQGAYIGHHLDLCKKCKRLFEDYKGKMESYFMVNDEPIKILNDEKYWDIKGKFKK